MKHHQQKGKAMKALGIIGLFVGYVAVILAANYVTTEYGMVPVGFGLTATAGTYLIGLLLILRDALQDVAGKRLVLLAIAAGAIFSFLISAPAIATASVAAFALSEVTDLAIYTPLRKRGYVRAAISSNVVGSVVDTVVFLSVAGFPVFVALPGQLVGKLLITAIVVLGIGAFRARRAMIA